jgi:hypothetical protein
VSYFRCLFIHITNYVFFNVKSSLVPYRQQSTKSQTSVTKKNSPYRYSPFQDTSGTAEYAVARVDDLLNWARKASTFWKHWRSGTCICLALFIILIILLAALHTYIHRRLVVILSGIHGWLLCVYGFPWSLGWNRFQILKANILCESWVTSLHVVVLSQIS